LDGFAAEFEQARFGEDALLAVADLAGLARRYFYGVAEGEQHLPGLLELGVLLVYLLLVVLFGLVKWVILEGGLLLQLGQSEQDSQRRKRQRRHSTPQQLPIYHFNIQIITKKMQKKLLISFLNE
jgi:hypothetical protein